MGNFGIVIVRKFMRNIMNVLHKREISNMQSENLKYFCTEEKREGTCYHEFQKGKWDEHTFWKEDSLLISDDVLAELKLGRLFRKGIQDYDPYGPVEVNKAQWSVLLELAGESGGEILAALQEADIWAQECFAAEDVFTILGI